MRSNYICHGKKKAGADQVDGNCQIWFARGRANERALEVQWDIRGIHAVHRWDALRLLRLQ